MFTLQVSSGRESVHMASEQRRESVLHGKSSEHRRESAHVARKQRRQCDMASRQLRDSMKMDSRQLRDSVTWQKSSVFRQ